LSRKSSSRNQDRCQTQPSEWPKTSWRPTDCKSATCIRAGCQEGIRQSECDAKITINCSKAGFGEYSGSESLQTRPRGQRAVICGTPWGPKAEIPLPPKQNLQHECDLARRRSPKTDSRRHFIGRGQEMESEVFCQTNPGTAKM
jgi:hypothetical protein